MPETLSSFIVSQSGWIAVDDLTGIPTGTPLVIQNQSGMHFYIALSEFIPNADFRGVIIPANLSIVTRVTAGEPRVWIKGTGRINVQRDE